MKKVIPFLFVILSSCVTSQFSDRPVSLYSQLKQFPDTPFYFLKYDYDYNLSKIKQNGIKITSIVPSLTKNLLEVDDHNCSTLFINGDNKLVGRNFDEDSKSVLVLETNPDDGYKSISVIDLHYLGVDETIDKDDSINLLYAPYTVFDGFNEKGLSITEMSLDYNKNIIDKSKPNITDCLSIRLVLDYAANVEEAIEILETYNIHFSGMSWHYLIADNSGKSVIAEYVDGELKYIPISGDWQMSANDVVYNKTNSQRLYDPRYSTIYNSLINKDIKEYTTDNLFEHMNSIGYSDRTMWTSLYNLNTGYYKIIYRLNENIYFEGNIYN